MPQFKTWTAGDILTAQDVNDFLGKQSVIVCTGSGDRPSSPPEGMLIYEADVNRYMTYTGSAWQPLLFDPTEAINWATSGAVVTTAGDANGSVSSTSWTNVVSASSQTATYGRLFIVNGIASAVNDTGGGDMAIGVRVLATEAQDVIAEGWADTTYHADAGAAFDPQGSTPLTVSVAGLYMVPANTAINFRVGVRWSGTVSGTINDARMSFNSVAFTVGTP